MILPLCGGGEKGYKNVMEKKSMLSLVVIFFSPASVDGCRTVIELLVIR